MLEFITPNISSTAQVSDSGELRVSESYALRDPTSPQFIARPMSRVVTAGHNLTFDCAANGYPDPSITWLKDGATIDMQSVLFTTSWLIFIKTCSQYYSLHLGSYS